MPAAGVGRRFSERMPKQFFPLNGQTVAQLCLDKLLRVPDVEQVIVACDMGNPNWSDMPARNDARVRLIAGGCNRAESVYQGLLAISDVAEKHDWVLVHDIVRPCVTLGAIARLKQEVSAHSVGGILVAPVSDTLKIVDAKGVIVGTQDRQDYRLAQTPQMVRYGELYAAMGVVLASTKVTTDEAEALEIAGRPLLAVQGRSDNIKITRYEDLQVATAILKAQEESVCV